MKDSAMLENKYSLVKKRIKYQFEINMIKDSTNQIKITKNTLLDYDLKFASNFINNSLSSNNWGKVKRFSKSNPIECILKNEKSHKSDILTKIETSIKVPLIYPLDERELDIFLKVNINLLENYALSKELIDFCKFIKKKNNNFDIFLECNQMIDTFTYHNKCKICRINSRFKEIFNKSTQNNNNC